MRTHEQIIADAGGYQAAAARIRPNDAVLVGRVRFWARRKSIPADQWNAVVGAGLATLKELADAAEARGRQAANDSRPSAQDAAA